LEGVDLMRTDGYVSAAHTDADISMTCEALDRAITRLREDGSLLRDHEHSVGNAP